MENAEAAFWEAGLRKFKLELLEDQRIVRSAHHGSNSLTDALEWLDLKAMISLQQEASELAGEFVGHFFPTLKAESWDQLPGAMAVAASREVPRAEAISKRSPQCTGLLIIKLNFQCA